jgi:hypothetical protein
MTQPSDAASSVTATGTVRTLVLVPFRLRTYASVVYLALAFPLGVTYFVLLVAVFGLGAGLVPVLVGVPVLIAGLALSVGLASVERWLADRLTPVSVPSREQRAAERRGEDGDGDATDGARDEDALRRLWSWTLSLVTDVGTYVSLVFVLSKFLVGIGTFVLLVVLGSFSAALLSTPLIYDRPGIEVGVRIPATTVVPAIEFTQGLSTVAISEPIVLHSWTVTTFEDALLMAGAGLALLVASLYVCVGLAWLLGVATRITFRYARTWSPSSSRLSASDWSPSAK